MGSYLRTFRENLSVPYLRLTPSVGELLLPHSNGSILTSLSKPLDGLRKSEERYITTAAWEHPWCLGILVYLLISLAISSFVQPNKSHSQVLLSSKLAANYQFIPSWSLSPLRTCTTPIVINLLLFGFLVPSYLYNPYCYQFTPIWFLSPLRTCTTPTQQGDTSNTLQCSD